MVNGPPPGPAPACHALASNWLAAHPVQLADVAPPEAAQEGPQGGWRLDCAADGASCPAGTQYVGVVNAVAARQRGSDQHQQLVPRVGALAPRRGRGDGRRVPAGLGAWARVAGRSRPALATKRWSSKAMRIRSGLLRASIYWVLPVSGWFFCSKTIIPDSEEHPLASSRAVPKALPRWIRAKAKAGCTFKWR